MKIGVTCVQHNRVRSVFAEPIHTRKKQVQSEKEKKNVILIITPARNTSGKDPGTTKATTERRRMNPGHKKGTISVDSGQK